MVGPADYTRAGSTVTREVIDVSTPENSSDDTATTEAAEARTAVQLDPDLAMAALGAADTNLLSLDELLAAHLHVRGGTMTDSGPLTPEEVLGTDVLSRRGGMIRPKTVGQKRYVDAIDANTVVFGLGPAGTGKTYLAMAKAVAALRAKEVSRLILTRPAVEAGERLGYLPGSLHEKIDPYLRPLYDSLHDMMDPETIPKLMAAGVIEVAPLAYMRGRTLNDAFIILDEAQNTTPE